MKESIKEQIYNALHPVVWKIAAEIRKTISASSKLIHPCTIHIAARALEELVKEGHAEKRKRNISEKQQKIRNGHGEWEYRKAQKGAREPEKKISFPSLENISKLQPVA